MVSATSRPLRSAVIALAALLWLMLVADASAAVKRGTYAGVSDQGSACLDGQQPCAASAKVTGKRTRTVVFDFLLAAPCQNGRTLKLGQKTGKLRQGRPGFSRKGKIALDLDNVTNLDGGIEVTTLTTFDGRFKGNRYTGRFFGKSTVKYPDGTTTSCETPNPVSLVLKRGR